MDVLHSEGDEGKESSIHVVRTGTKSSATASKTGLCEALHGPRLPLAVVK